MFEVVHDWNYTTALIRMESAFIFHATSRARNCRSMKALSSLPAKK
jgi:hypothetical protein